MGRKQIKGSVRFYEQRFYGFSNFASFAVFWKGRLWMTSEHAYQSEKFILKQDKEDIFRQPSAHLAKKRARELVAECLEHVRPDWEEEKLCVMEQILRAKLEQHAFLQKELLASGNRELIEDSPKDGFWGRGPDGKGLNHLGRIWMKLRAELRASEAMKRAAG
ncbi:MAG: NADAR family protein [Patescibacteria group bacterium]